MKRPSLNTGLNVLLLVVMVFTNLLSLYRLSSSRSPDLHLSTASDSSVPDHLLRHLHALQATISHLTHLRSSSSSSAVPPPPPPELALYSQLSPIPTACASSPDLLISFMSYTPFSLCPDDLLTVQEPLMLRGCHPLPRRRCFPRTLPHPPSTFSPNSSPFSPIPSSSIRWPPSSSKCADFSCFPPHLGFDFAGVEAARFISSTSPLDLSIPQLLRLAEFHKAAPLALALDVAGGTATLAVRLRELANTTVLTTTMNLGAPYSEVAALRGAVPLHTPLQQRFPIHDGILDLVRTGHAVNRWIPLPTMDMLLYDVDRVLRPGGLFWIDHFFCKDKDLDQVYAPMLEKLQYRTIRWATANKTDAGAGGRNRDEVFLTALLQKPFTRLEPSD